MANNCLQTKLKSVVNNDLLITPDEYLLSVDAKTSNTIGTFGFYNYGNNRPELKLVAVDGTSFALTEAGVTSDPLTEYTIPLNYGITYLYYKGRARVKVLNKLAIVGVNIGNCVNTQNINQFSFLSALWDIYADGSNVTGDMRALKTLTVTDRLICRNTSITGDIKWIPASTTIVQIDGSNKVMGDIKDLGHVVNIKRLYFRGTQICGSINEMCDAILVNKPTRSGSIEISGNGIITYKVNNVDTPVTGTVNVTFDGQGGYTIS